MKAINKKHTWEEAKIPLKELVLWDENARFPDKYFSKSEEELIKYFCSKTSFKMGSFVGDVAKDVDLPQLEKLVVYRVDNNNIVLEGNRRLTAYKLLNNPNLAPTEKLKDKLIKLKKIVRIDKNFLLECLITENKSEGFRYIERKHLKTNNEVGWGDQERTNHKVRVGTATKKQEFKFSIEKIIEKLNIPEQFKEKVLGPGYVSTFWRIVDSSAAWEKYGFKLKDDGKLEVINEKFPQYLKGIILNVLNKKDFYGKIVGSRSLNTTDEIKEYLEKLSLFDSKQIDGEVKKNTESDLFGEDIFGSGDSKKRKTPTTKQKDILFGKKLFLKGGKVNDLYSAILHIYGQNMNNFSKFDLISPIIGMSLRLILDVAAREYYLDVDPKKAGKDQLLTPFLKVVKNDFKDQNIQKNLNYLSLTSAWLSDRHKIEGLLMKWAHGNLMTNKSELLNMSYVVGDILTIYFKK